MNEAFRGEGYARIRVILWQIHILRLRSKWYRLTRRPERVREMLLRARALVDGARRAGLMEAPDGN